MKTNNYKGLQAFFFDLDNTTYDHNYDCVRPSTYEALRKLKEKGKIIVLDTSRSLPELYNAPKDFLEMFDFIITLAGGYIINKDKVTVNFISDETVKSIINFLEKNDLTYRYVTDDGNGYLNKHDKDKEGFFYSLYGMVPPIKKYENEKLCGLLFYGPLELRQQVYTLLHGENYADLSRGGEIYPTNCDKGEAMLQVGKMYGYSSEQLCSFGDSNNDVPMLEKAGFSIALKKCSDDARQACDYVAEDISDEGLYKALLNFGIID